MTQRESLSVGQYERPALSVERREALASRRASRVFKLSIATLFARRIIGQGINYVRNVPPNYAIETLFKDPPAKEDCPICFLPMPARLICCISLQPANISSVPIYDFAKENVE